MWIEILRQKGKVATLACRGSREPCGLKLTSADTAMRYRWSRLARALWIEIADGVKGKIQEARRGSREPCGLKCEVDVAERAYQRRGSREPCGLKCTHTA